MAAVVLNDFSPTLLYRPAVRDDADPNAARGWTALFDGATLARGAEATGSSAHTTSLSGADLDLEFTGSAISLRGTAKAEYAVLIDSIEQPILGFDDGVLFDIANLTYERHSLQLLARGDISVTGVVVPLNSPQLVDFRLSNASRWNMQGTWQSTLTTRLPDNTSQTTFGSSQQGDSLSMQFQGGSVVVRGLVSPTAGLFNVTIDGTTNVQLNGFSPWIVRTELFWLTGLDPTQVHSLLVVNAQQGSTLQIQTIEVASPGTGEPPPPGTTDPPPAVASGLPQGTVIALITGSVVAFICLLIFLFLIWRHLYRRRQRNVIRRPFPGRGKDQFHHPDSGHFVDMAASNPNSSVIQQYPRPPPPPVAFPPAPESNSPSSSSPFPTLQSSLRRKFERATGFFPAIKDNSIVSTNRSLGRRTYIRSINSLHQEYAYDSRDRDDVAIITPEDPDAGFRISDDHDRDGVKDDFVVDADAVFAALSRPQPPQASKFSTSSISELDLETSDSSARRRTKASFLDFMSHTSSSKEHRSHRTDSMIKSMTASEMTASSGASASASIPFFSHINRTSVPTQARTFDPGAAAGPGMEMRRVGSRSRPRLGIVSFQTDLDDEPLRTPEDSVPRSISPMAFRSGPSAPAPPPIPPAAPLPPVPRRQSGQTDSEQYYSVASGAEHVLHSLQGSGSSSYGGRPAVPSGESSKILQLLPPSHSPVPSSLDMRGHDRGPSSGRTSPLPPSSSPPPPPPPPPSGPPPALPHPFASAGPDAPRGAPPVAPPVRVNVEPASPLPMPQSPLGSTPPGPSRSTPSPPPWPLPTRTHKERVLRRILGSDDPTPSGGSRPRLPSFDRS